MGLIVQKYGGTSVKDAERVMNVARRITDAYKAGNNVVVAVSAQGDTTDDLIEKAKEINPNASKREMDMLLSTGEQISISLLAMAIEKIGCPVISLTGWQAGVKTDAKYGAARISTIDTERLQAELDKKNIVITDVDGVYTADPRFVKNAYKLDDISYDEMLELASLGANVLHNRSVEMAKKYGVKLSVRSSLNNNEGTYVKEVEQVEKMLVRGVTRDNDVARIALCGVEDTPGKAFSVFRMLAKHGISVDLIIQSIGNGEKKDISFTVTEEDLQPVLDLLEENKAIVKADEVKWTKDVSKVSIVGAGMVNNSGVAATMFEALYDAHININMIATSEIKISVLVDRKDAEAAVVAIHDKFLLK